MIKILFILVAIFTISGADNINIDAMVDKAEKSHKHVLIFLHKPNCSYCETMIEFTLPDKKIVQNIKKNFIFVDIDIGDSGYVTFEDFKGTKQEFAISIGYNFYPSSIFIDENREIVYAKPGYKDEDEFLHILRFVQSRSYEKMSIEDFK
ncbi:thioredoxin family protein [Sulfurimonas sp.]|uniref:thioredoxin family protein n=1 Tax=Sulfurimonas sp. TaxID=2022749 RepID=UPI002B48819A|nr:thioredoxin fold domain-containing protein [Sulfurimonas sp.]